MVILNAKRLRPFQSAKKGDNRQMKVTLIGKSKKVHEGVSKSKNIPYTYCDVVLTYEAGFVDG